MRYKSEMMHIVHIWDARVQGEEKRIDKGLSFIILQENVSLRGSGDYANNITSYSPFYD